MLCMGQKSFVEVTKMSTKVNPSVAERTQAEVAENYTEPNADSNFHHYRNTNKIDVARLYLIILTMNYFLRC